MYHHTENPAICDEQIVNWIRLSRSQNIGRNTFFNLLEFFGSVDKALENAAELSIKGGLKKPIAIYPRNKAIEELERTRRFGANIITFNDPKYPLLLKEISDPPPILTYRGNADLLNKDIVAIVGPRNSSFAGCKFAKIIAEGLGRAGIIVSSGMARGIDTVAHQSSLQSGTIAVLAGGIDHIYPSENHQLYHQIADCGVVISEIPFGVLPRGGNFPQRNRIISGLSLGVVVIEATLRSGTLITARLAAEQNREVFAVPGSPFDPRSHGANRLIKNGATMITSVDDILDELPSLKANQQTQFEFRDSGIIDFVGFEPNIPDDQQIDEARDLILSKISYVAIDIDEIISELGLPTRVVNVACMQLELAGRIDNVNGKICLK
ncbi:MAG: DNA-processing protein DprA [Proteobacteria bacterium]|nr:DNA-processing protein DprA [Pseudomonadota bacterium]